MNFLCLWHVFGLFGTLHTDMVFEYILNDATSKKYIYKRSLTMPLVHRAMGQYAGWPADSLPSIKILYARLFTCSCLLEY